MKYVVAQLGARMHYAVPRIFAKAGRLEKIYSDFASSGRMKAFFSWLPSRMRPGILKRLLGRDPLMTSQRQIKVFPLLGFQYYLKRKLSKTKRRETSTFLWAGKRFGRLVAAEGFGDGGAVYGFNSASLEIFESAKSKKLKCILEQTIAPRKVEEDLILEETKKWPGWEKEREPGDYPNEFITREKKEWELADLIVCGSDFVKRGIEEAGGPVQKCKVVPYGVENAGLPWPRPLSTDPKGPLKLLTVGAVGLRKGAPWLWKVAKEFRGEAQFCWVGPITISAHAQSWMKPYVELTGQVPRTEMERYYSWADAFILLSICEGSATVIYEALSRGIPVLCSENTGAPKLKTACLQESPIREIRKIKKTIDEWIELKHKNRFPVVPNAVREYCSIESYSKRLLSAL